MVVPIKTQKNRFQEGIHYQRELCKAAKRGEGINNYDLMADSLENIKSDIKQKAINAGFKEQIKEVETILKQYRTLEYKYLTPTPEGLKVKYPIDIHNKVNNGLTEAYEKIMVIITGLDLL